MIDGLYLVIIGLYGVSTLLYLLFLFYQKEKFQRAGYTAFLIGFLFHLTTLGSELFQLGHFPAHNLHATISLCACAIAGVFLLLRFRFHLKILGVFAAPSAMFLMIIAANIPKVPPEAEHLFKSLWLVIHVIGAIIGEAALAMAFATGILYLIQENGIKNKKRGFFYKRLPSLEQLDKTGYGCIIIGFTALTIGLVAGLIYARVVWHRFADWDPKEVWSGISWLIYAVLLHERLTVGWRGRRSAILAIIGFCVLVFTFIGVNFILGGHHNIFTRM